MAEALTEPLLPRGRGDSSTPPAHCTDIAPSTAATPPAHRHGINVGAPAFAGDRPDAALKGTSASTPATPSRGCRATERDDVHRALKGPSASTPATPSRGRRATEPDDAHRALKGPSASPTATPSRGHRANPMASLGPASGADASSRPAYASPADVFMYTSMSDALRRTGSPAASISPIEDASPSPHRVRNLPGILGSPEIKTESVGRDSDEGSTNDREITSKRDRSSFRTPRGRRLYRRVGIRLTLMPVPKKDSWDRESFLYTCVLVLLIGLVAYLSTVLDGWPPYLRGIFIAMFGVATGLACIGAMALISETPDPSTRRFAHIASRLAFIVGSLAFEAAVFFLLGDFGFVAWLLVAACTIGGMTRIWSKEPLGPESFAALVSCTGSVYSRVMGLFRRA